MSDFSLEQALYESVEEVTRLIAELHDLRTQVRLAEAATLAKRHADAANPQAVPAEQPARGSGPSEFRPRLAAVP